MKPHPNDTQYPYPTKDSPFVIMKYGDGWGIYDRRLDEMVLNAEGDHPFEVHSPSSCESAIRMLLTPRRPKRFRLM